MTNVIGIDPVEQNNEHRCLEGDVANIIVQLDAIRRKYQDELSCFYILEEIYTWLQTFDPAFAGGE